jgi:hypothetical protein
MRHTFTAFKRLFFIRFLHPHNRKGSHTPARNRGCTCDVRPRAPPLPADVMQSEAVP